MQRQTISNKAVTVLVLAAVVFALWWRGPTWLRALAPRTYHGSPFLPDFFQDWASARNQLEGLPVYGSLEEALERYLGEHRRPGDTIFIEVNAHPPGSVLLTLPFALLSYREAFVLWTELCLIMLVLSIWLVLGGLRLRVDLPRGLLVCLLLQFCHPLVSHFQQGQWSILLLFLATLGWFWERKGRPWLAGICFGLAAGLKLVPAFLFFPFLLRWQWRVLLGGLAGLLGLSLLTGVVLGWDTSWTYFQEVVPHVTRYRGACHNLSLCGICYKLLAPLPHWMPVEFTVPWQAPIAAAAMWLAISGVIVGLLAWSIPTRCQDADLCLALAIVAMLLISPVTWDHYLVLLVLPLAVLWQRLPRHTMAWPPFLFSATILWLEPLAVMQHGLILLGTARSGQTGRWLLGPVEVLTAISIPAYALLCLFILLLLSPTIARSARLSLPTNCPSDVADGPAEKRLAEQRPASGDSAGDRTSTVGEQDCPPQVTGTHPACHPDMPSAGAENANPRETCTHER